VANVIIKGDCDDAIAKLRGSLRANDAKFDAQLAAMFKSTPKSAAKSEEVRPQATKPAAPQASKNKKEWASLTRRPDGDGSGGSKRSSLRK
jgi:hypothetical protein